MDKHRLLAAIRSGSTDPFFDAQYHGGKGSPPPPPDYGAVAKEQDAANVETARLQNRANNPNIYTPYGYQTVTWGSGTPATGPTFDQAGYDAALNAYDQRRTAFEDRYNDWEGRGPRPTFNESAPDRNSFMTAGTPGGGYDDQPTVRQYLNPEQQALLDSQNRIMGNLAGVAESGLYRVGNAMATPFDTSNLPGMRSGYGTDIGLVSNVNGSPLRMGYDSGGDITRSFSQGQPVQGSVQQYDRQTNFDPGFNIQRGLDYSGVSRIPTIDDFSADRKRIEDALYARAEPQLQRDEDAMRTRLANMGLTQGTEAWQREIDAFNRQKNDQRNQITLAGAGEQSRLFGMGLQARQQGVGEINTQGAFANSAQQQQFLQNQARANFFNDAQNQRFQQGLLAGNFANSAAGQQYAQNLGQAQFQNQAQSQANAQSRAAADFYNQSAQGNFNQDMQRAALTNSAQAQAMQQQAALAAFQNNARQQGISEQAYLRSLPLNELSALRSGTQITMPQFQQFQGSNIAPPPVFQGAQAGYNAALGGYNAQQAQNANTMNGLFGLGQAGIMAMGMSDIRLKSNIERIGTHPLGIGIYEYDIFGRRERGVMAQELIKVKPEAVHRHPSGYLMVNYGAI